MSDRLPDKLESNGRVEVRVDGTVIGTRRIIDFVSSGGNADDGGVDDKVSVDTSAFSGTELWELDGFGDLHPLADPSSFSVNTAGEILLSSTATTGTAVEIQAPGVGGIISLDAYDNVGIFSSHQQAFVFAHRNVTVESEIADVTVVSDAAQVIISAATDAFISGNRDTVIGSSGTDQVDIRTTASAPTDGRMQTGSIVFYLDEVGNTLKVRVKYSDGTTFKTGTIALI